MRESQFYLSWCSYFASFHWSPISMPMSMPILMPSHLRHKVLLLHSIVHSMMISFSSLSFWVLPVASCFHYFDWFLPLLLLMGFWFSSDSEPILFLISFPPTDDVDRIYYFVYRSFLILLFLLPLFPMGLITEWLRRCPFSLRSARSSAIMNPSVSIAIFSFWS